MYRFYDEFCKRGKEKARSGKYRISAIGSPIGKIGIDDDFDAHLQKLSHTEQMADIFETPYIRMFSLYPGKLCCGRLPLRGVFPDGGDGCRGRA
ncbi:MAG: hypothetical protein ACLURV_13000 [Gallintestinimicrobium sp.]